MKKKESRFPPKEALPADVNPSQWKAITHNGKHLLIVAGPGTGKTHTLTYRIVQILKELSADKKVLAITFTNKAAEEMRERLKKRLSSSEESVEVETFHSFCLQFIRQFINQTALPEDFTLASPEAIVQFAKHIWPNKNSRDRKIVLEQIAQWKSSVPSADVPPDVELYDQRLRDRKWLDFDDLLCETLKLLQSNQKVLSALHKTYAHIFVDEYQDINAIQHALLKFLAGPEAGVTAIGDPNQAIYGFRGSDVRFFEKFVEDFSGAKTFSLSENYRSAANLLSASGQIIAKSKSQYISELTAKIHHEGCLTIHQAATDKAEAEYVVHQIEKMVGGTSMFSRDSGRIDGNQESLHSFGEIAVLYRLKSQRLALQEAFERSGIPFHVTGAKSEDPLDEVCPPREENITFEAEKVSLMTLHAAKGLEFPVVFIVGCEQNILPLDMEGMGADKEEERRLLYVGMTRAKQKLYLLSAQRRRLYGRSWENQPSPFLADIKEELKAYESQVVKKRRKKDQMTLF